MDDTPEKKRHSNIRSHKHPIFISLFLNVYHIIEANLSQIQFNDSEKQTCVWILACNQNKLWRGSFEVTSIDCAYSINNNNQPLSLAFGNIARLLDIAIAVIES